MPLQTCEWIKESLSLNSWWRYLFRVAVSRNIRLKSTYIIIRCEENKEGIVEIVI